MKTTVMLFSAIMVIVTPIFALPMRPPAKYHSSSNRIPSTTRHDHQKEHEDWYPEDWQHDHVDPMGQFGHNKAPDTHHDEIRADSAASSSTSRPNTAPDGTPYGVWRTVPPRNKSIQTPSTQGVKDSTSTSHAQRKRSMKERAAAIKLKLQQRYHQASQNPHTRYKALLDQLDPDGTRGVETKLKVSAAIGLAKHQNRGPEHQAFRDAFPDMRGAAKGLPSLVDFQLLPPSKQMKWEHALEWTIKKGNEEKPLSSLDGEYWPLTTKIKDVEPPSVQPLTETQREAYRLHQNTFPDREREIGTMEAGERATYLTSHLSLRRDSGFSHFPAPKRGPQKRVYTISQYQEFQHKHNERKKLKKASNDANP